jgi:hypothetical protein
MARLGDNIYIPIPEQEALRLLLKVKPTEDMPRPGTNPTESKPKAKAPRKKPTRKMGAHRSGRTT